MSVDAVERLEAQLQDVHDVYIGSGWDAESYIAGLISSLREAICPPFAVTAEVEEPGFPDAKVGESISGDCVAHREGYWLVYQQENDRFLCFWGVDVAHLSAPGIFGSPLGCWSS